MIHDPIYGDIILSEWAIKIIDHPYFNRTQNIYQTGTAYKVFPSATHTRKAHMIGTYAITHKLLSHLQESVDISDRKKELIAIGALCHDIGHGPGSHGFDKHVIKQLIKDKIDNNSVQYKYMSYQIPNQGKDLHKQQGYNEQLNIKIKSLESMIYLFENM